MPHTQTHTAGIPPPPLSLPLQAGPFSTWRNSETPDGDGVAAQSANQAALQLRGKINRISPALFKYTQFNSLSNKSWISYGCWERFLKLIKQKSSPVLAISQKELT